jgi:AraC-like DNA-binding protein
MSRPQTKESVQPTVGTVRIGTIAAIPKVLEHLGYDPEAFLAELGVDKSLFDDPDNVIPYALRSQLIHQCAHKTSCQHFGLLIGQYTGASSFGLVGFLMLQSPDVATALRALVRYAHLHVRGAAIYLEEDGDSTFLGYSIYQPQIQAREQIEDGAVAIACNILRGLCGPEWIPTEIYFAHRKPADVRPYQQFFKTRLNFNAERNGVLFPSSWMEQPVLSADPDLRRLLQKQVDQLESRYGDDFAEQVRRVLHSALLTQHATADEVAALFSIHPRTLNRRLKAYGTGFQELVDQSRFEIAQQLLENSSLDVIQIAAALDYADASAFTRAFRRWSGTTPALWREQHHRGGDTRPVRNNLENHNN